MNYAGRQRKLREALAQNRLDVLLVTHLPNIRYLSGFTGSAGALLLTEKGSVFLTDGRYTAQARAEVQGARVVIARKLPLVMATEWLRSQGRRLARGRQIRAGVEAHHLTVAEHHRLKAGLGRDFQLRMAPALVEQARMVKDDTEIKCLRSAAALGSRLFETALKALGPEVTEAEVAARMEFTARKLGAESMSFPTIIASGRRSALPHGRASEAAIAANSFVVCDFGVILTGYCSDMTRTAYVGRPGEAARRLYAAVQEAQQAALDAVQPGRTTGDVDNAARKCLRMSGLGRYFSHSTGHGVGLEIHEAPRIAAGQTEVLQPGMVITIEPGVYLLGKWGVRIEDTVVVTERGCEILTRTSKELTAV
jgi:Xaa-Pro aminopeptidase